MDTPATVNERIHQLRRSACLKQTELGRLIGVSGNVVSQWESGKNTPRLYQVPKLAAAFAVTCDYLLTGREP